MTVHLWRQQVTDVTVSGQMEPHECMHCYACLGRYDDGIAKVEKNENNSRVSNIQLEAL